MKKTDDQLVEIAQQHENRTTFQQADPANYMACYRRKLLDKAFGPPVVNRYTDEEIIASALQFTTRGDWAKNERGAYNAAKRRPDGFFETVTGHMVSVREEWDDETIRAVAESVKDQDQFRILARGAWSAAVRRGMLPELVAMWEAQSDG